MIAEFNRLEPKKQLQLLRALSRLKHTDDGDQLFVFLSAVLETQKDLLMDVELNKASGLQGRAKAVAELLAVVDMANKDDMSKLSSAIDRHI
ncbi:hypothetical protein [Photobacterium damselae]|uniref:hypothetical protein n=1 Tax=Photobacterium damselae TaxID=38293 RepID=UPI001F2ECA4A|nr:hypothetical protein [Photobacterium damselae]UKA12926.1 hypothetical protein IHC91_21650 [Photobacterium damselae subsp. damselae]